MLSINKISVHFTGDYIFKDLSFLINDRDRIGLVGRNGAGKTTLLNVIHGLLEPESGDIVLPKGQKTGYLEQHTKLNSEETVFNEALKAFNEIIKLKNQIDKFSIQLGERTDYESDSYSNLIEKLNNANERFSIVGGHNIEGNTEKVLLGLGFLNSDFQRPLKEFSGGWQMRVELAKLLLSQPEVLLLDEPTNHLDIESIQWLEVFLQTYPGAVVVVSHDRAFLDSVTNRTIEISLGKINDYKAAYSEYTVIKQQELERQKATYDNQQQQISEIEQFINKFRYKSTKARQVQSRVKFLEKMDNIELEERDNTNIRFSFPPAPHSGKIVWRAEKLSKSYDDNQVLRNVETTVIKGDKIAFVGKNGEGKSTLAKIIIGDLDFKGESVLGHQVVIGYFAQNQADLMDGNKTVFQIIDDVAVGDIRRRIRGILGSFLFGDDDLDKKVSVLSGGEKTRLALAKLLLSPVNFLVLDEPTNHLDMQSKDVLKNALLQYDGTLIVVSHDRDFLQGLTAKVYEFRDKNIKEHTGDVFTFLDNRKLKDLADLELKKKIQVEKKENVSDNKRSYEQKKEREREKRKIKTRIAKSEERISEIEKEINRLDTILQDPSLYTGSIDDIYTEYKKFQNELESEMHSWEQLEEDLVKFND